MNSITHILEAASFTIGVFLLTLGLGHWLITVRAGKKDLLGPGSMLVGMGAWLLWG